MDSGALEMSKEPGMPDDGAALTAAPTKPYETATNIDKPHKTEAEDIGMQPHDQSPSKHDNQATAPGDQHGMHSPGKTVVPGFEPEVRLKPTLQAYLVWLVTCPCGTKRVIDRRRGMDTFLATHRGHHPAWETVTSLDFDWSLATRENSKKPVARRINEDLGPTWKKARSGEWDLLSRPSNWHSIAMQAVVNLRTWKEKQTTAHSPQSSQSQRPTVASHSSAPPGLATIQDIAPKATADSQRSTPPLLPQDTSAAGCRL